MKQALPHSDPKPVALFHISIKALKPQRLGSSPLLKSPLIPSRRLNSTQVCRLGWIHVAL